MRITHERIEDGWVVPWGYGVAWRDFRLDSTIYMIVPFNILASIIRRIWIWLVVNPLRNSSLNYITQEECRKARLNGYEIGYARGCRDGEENLMRGLERIAREGVRRDEGRDNPS